MSLRTLLPLPLLLPLLLTSACLVPKKKYDALQAELDAARATTSSTQAALDASQKNLATTLADLDAAKRRGVDLETALRAEQEKVRSLSAEIEKLNAEKAALLSDRKALKASVEDMEQALAQMEARRAQAEARVAEYKSLLARFQALIDAGKLRVKIVNGRMVVELATDVLFASGDASLSKDGAAAVTEVGKVLATIPDRSFQVEGHTDNVPIKTERFPSNWELASARAITVVHQLVGAGVAADRVSAASYGEYRPVQANDTAAHKAANRRIEIVVVPDLTGLPGFEELKKLEQ